MLFKTELQKIDLDLRALSRRLMPKYYRSRSGLRKLKINQNSPIKIVRSQWKTSWLVCSLLFSQFYQFSRSIMLSKGAMTLSRSQYRTPLAPHHINTSIGSLNPGARDRRERRRALIGRFHRSRELFINRIKRKAAKRPTKSKEGTKNRRKKHNKQQKWVSFLCIFINCWVLHGLLTLVQMVKA